MKYTVRARDNRSATTNAISGTVTSEKERNSLLWTLSNQRKMLLVYYYVEFKKTCYVLGQELYVAFHVSKMVAKALL